MQFKHVLSSVFFGLLLLAAPHSIAEDGSTGADSISISVDPSSNSLLVSDSPNLGDIKTLKIYDHKKHLIRNYPFDATTYSIEGLKPGVYLLIIDYGTSSSVQAIEIPEAGPSKNYKLGVTR